MMMRRIPRCLSARSAGSAAAAAGRRSFSSLLTLEEEFEGTPKHPPSQPSAPASQVSSLANGVKVLSYDSGSAIASYGVVLSSGSRAEDPFQRGCALFAQNLAFRTTTNRSTLQITRSLEDAGATGAASGGREMTLMQVHGRAGPELAEMAVGTLAETTLYCAGGFELEEISKKVSEIDLTEAHRSAKVSVNEALYSAAYGENSALGHSIFLPAKTSSVFPYLDATRTSNNMTLVGSGIAHADLLTLAEESFGKVESGPAPVLVESPYTGGEVRVQAAISPYTQVSLAFEGVGGCEPDAAAFGVLKHVLSQRVSIAAAGSISPRCSMNSFGLSLSDTGLLGVTGQAPVSDEDHDAGMGGLLAAMSSCLKGLSSSKPTAAEVEGAKAAYKLELLQGVSSPSECVAALYSGALNLASSVDGVQAADVASVAAKVTKSKLSMAAVGEVAAVPRLSSL